MIRKSVKRFSEKIMRKNKQRPSEDGRHQFIHYSAGCSASVISDTSTLPLVSGL
jgi:hypothetical protein